MSQIEKLIAEQCPGGVKFEAIGALTERTSNIRWQDSKGKKFNYVDLTSVNRVTHSIGDTKTIDSDSAPNRAQKIILKGDVLFGTTRPTLKRYCLIPEEYTGQICSTGFCVLRPRSHLLHPHFLFHILGTENFYSYVEANQRGASYPAISDSAVRKFKVPLPPLEIQHAIVGILDKFTELEAELETELEAELEARKRQYQYYRDKLLNSSEGRSMTLGDIGKVSMCKRVFKRETQPKGGIPFFKIGTFGSDPDAFIPRVLYQEYKTKYSFPKTGDILISAAGTIGRAIPYDGKDAYFQDSNIVWLDNDESLVSNKYLFHWYQIVNWNTDGGTIRRLYNDKLLQTKIQVPPLKVQHEIVAILDRFDALVNDLSHGLPAEITARRKQYEYYRDRLLTFKEAE